MGVIACQDQSCDATEECFCDCTNLLPVSCKGRLGTELFPHCKYACLSFALMISSIISKNNDSGFLRPMLI